MSALRLVLFTDSADPSGMGVHMLALARALRPEAEVTVLFADTPGGRAFVEAATREGLAAEALAIEDWTVERSLRRRLQALRPDVVHAHAGVQWEGLWIARAVREASGAPTVRTEHLPYLLTKPEDQAEHAAALPEFAAVICVSQGAGVGHRGRDPSGRDPRVIPNGVGAPRPRRGREATRAALAVEDGRPLLLTVARLFPQKGHGVLLHALHRLRDRPWTAAWAGDGDLADPLEWGIARLGLSDRIRLLGPRDDVGDLLAAADLFVLPSLFEGHPLSVLEAMHAGTPVVATAAAGTTEAVRDGEEALLVPPGDPAALADAIAAALDDPTGRERRAARALARAQAEFGVERMARETLAVYRAVLQPACETASA